MFLDTLSEPLEDAGVLSLGEELCCLESFLQERDLFRVVRIIIVCDAVLVKLLWNYFVSTTKVTEHKKIIK